MLHADIEDRFRAFEEDPARAQAHPEQLQELLADCREMYRQSIMARRHDDAIALVERLRRLVPRDVSLDRLAALAYAGKGELILGQADRLRVRPSGSLLDEMESLFSRAIETDPTLPDPYWDMAVLKARFRNDFAEAERFYRRARAMGYQHPMMPALEQLIRQGQAGRGG